MGPWSGGVNVAASPWDYLEVITRLYGDNGKENGNYYGMGFRVWGLWLRA